MIVDRAERASLYKGLNEHLAVALASLAGELPARADGRYELDGEHLIAVVQSYVSKPADQGKLEAHRRYIDLQYIVSGRERIRVWPLPELTTTSDYDAAKDVEFFATPPAGGWDLQLEAGMFAIFFPHDAHMPGLAMGEPETVKKVVFKVEV